MWAVLHAIASLLFLTLVALHIRSHWGWYKSLATAGCKGSRRKIVMLLSAVFAAVAVTGVLLLFIDGAGSSVGLFHYKAGLVLGVLSIFHIVRRGKILYKGIRTHLLGR